LRDIGGRIVAGRQIGQKERGHLLGGVKSGQCVVDIPQGFDVKPLFDQLRSQQGSRRPVASYQKYLGHSGTSMRLSVSGHPELCVPSYGVILTRARLPMASQALLEAGRDFLLTQGLPNRRWFRHTI